MASNVEATKKGYECFQRGDIPSLIRDLLDDNCIWISPGPRTSFLGPVLLEESKRSQISSPKWTELGVQ